MTIINYQKELNIAKKAAIVAGEKILEIYQRDFSYEEKSGDQGPVTEADLMADKVICSVLSQEFPLDAIISEEKEDDISRLKKSRIWCVDPLDGTKDFLMKNGEFAVHIGLIEKGSPVLGVVYLPAFNKMYFGGPSMGAFLEYEGKTINLKTNQVESIDQMIMAASRSHRDQNLHKFLNSVTLKHEIVHGSVGAKIGLIAEGKADFLVYFSDQTKEWDTCAPEAILVGASGKVTDIYGDLLSYNKTNLNNPKGVLASSGADHKSLVHKTSTIL